MVAYLLEAGAVCNEYTFDGDRCHYASLNEPIRVVLRQYEARAPPLGPLATDLRCLSSLCADPEAQVTIDYLGVMSDVASNPVSYSNNASGRCQLGH